jgi:cytochrome P450
MISKKRPSSLSLEDCTIEFSKAPADTLFERLQSLIKAVWVFPKRVYNTYLLIRYREFKKPASKNVCPMRYLNPFFYLNFSTQIAANSSLIKAILKHPRKDPDRGLFDDQDNALVFLPLFKELYPEEKVSSEDFIFTCSKENLRKYREPVLRFIGPQSMEKQSGELLSVIESTLQFFFRQNEKNRINATELSFALTIAVVSRLLLGHPGPVTTYLEIAKAVDFVNRYTMKKALKQPLSKSEKEDYFKSLAILREAIDASFHSRQPLPNGSFVEMLRDEKLLSPLQIKLSLYSMYTAGSDTTSALLGYLLWQLGQHPDLQEEIIQEMNQSEEDTYTYANHSVAINRLISESMRLFTPAYVIGRKPSSPLLCTIRDNAGNILFQKKIKKNEKLLSMPTCAARDPGVFENPDAFIPHRFETFVKNYSWFPFGDGAHSCPGQWLAKAEIAVCIALLMKKYRIRSFPENEPQQQGYLSLKTTEQILLELLPRDG